MDIVVLILATAFALFVHEFGHLVAAKMVKVPVSELSMGFGPKLFALKIKKIQFTLRVIPLGSYVMLDGTVLKSKSIREQLNVHMGGIAFNLIAALLTYGTVLCWMNILLAAGNILPLYQHDGWKCGRILVRAWLQRKSPRAEWAFTFSGGFISLVIGWLVIRMFV
jgi:membrane-associated protease RseP (regulator of RpoE activity)